MLHQRIEEPDESTSVSRRFMKVGLTLASTELAAFTLLVLDVAILLALGMPLAVALTYLMWPLLHRTLGTVSHVLGQLASRMLSCFRNPQTYRYRLTTLLFVILVVAVASSWYGRGLNAIRSERLWLSGKWVLINPDDGKPVVLKAGPRKGQNVIIELGRDTYRVDPTHEPMRIDIYHTDGTVSYGIYQLDHGFLRVMSSWCSAGPATRPPSFDVTIDDIDGPASPGAMASVSLSDNHYRRAN